MKLNIHVNPGSRSESIQWVENLFWEKSLIVKIRAKPVDGEANIGLIKVLAKFFKVPKSHIQILHGHTSRDKIVEIPEK